MKSHRLFYAAPFCLALLSVLAIPVDCDAVTVILEPTDDAFISSDDWANINSNDGPGGFGFGDRAVGQQNAFTGNQVGRQLYKFDVPNTVSGITSAVLRLKVYDNFAGSPHQTAVFGAGDSWVETAVTWNTQPAADSTELDSVNASCCGNLYDYDVTSYVQSQVSGSDLTISFSQRGQNEAVVGGVRWFLKEGDGVNLGIIGESPKLILHAAVPEPASAALMGIGSLILMARRKAAVE